MSSIEYSDDALNAKKAFYRVRALVYVEGDDDLSFWDSILSRVKGFNYEIEAAGGAPELDKIIDKIHSGRIDAIAARDSDYLDFSNKQNNPKVLYTFGFSIENSIYNAKSVNNIAKLCARNPRLREEDCDSWFRSTAGAFRALLVLEIANVLSGSGVLVAGENCMRFMMNKTSAEICEDAIRSHYDQVVAAIPSETIRAVDVALGDNSDVTLKYLRGHFLASAIIKFISRCMHRSGKKGSVSKDTLFSSAMIIFSQQLNHGHPHAEYYDVVVKGAIEAIV